jgi:Leucine-rich repeat (LRR) protein
MNPRLLRPQARFQAPPADPFATLVSTKSTGNVSGFARSTTGYIKVEWWDSTSNVYGMGVAGNNLAWSKAAGGAGSKTLLIYPSDASGNLSGSLTSLLCNNNSLTSLDVSGLTALTNLFCDGNSLTSLNVSGLTALTNLTCFSNSLTSLDVSGLTALTNLFCNNNSLTSLRAVGAVFDTGKWKNKKKGRATVVQAIFSNQLNAAALNQFYTDLGATTPGTGFLDVSGNSGITTDDPTIATNKGYVVFGS